MFTHYLITRFNIQVSNQGPETMDSPDMNLEWLTERLQLFIKYCAPSVLEQTNFNFTWIIYFHPDTPSTILKQLDLPSANFTTEIAFTKDYSSMMEDIVAKIKSATSPFVITSRLDNDDIIGRYFIRDIQNAFSPKHSTIINFTTGFEYSFLDGVLKKWNTRFNNQFTSIIEKKDDPEIHSIYGFPHWRLPQNATVINLDGQSSWMYLRHNLNYSGSVITGIPVFLKSKELQMFPASVREIPTSLINTLNYTVKWLPQVLRRRIKARFKK